MELEKMLKQEAKSRNKAEKKLKYLMKKLESINIADEAEHSGSIYKTDVYSISSTPSSIDQQQRRRHESNQNQHTEISEAFENQESRTQATFQKDLGNLKQIGSQNYYSSSLSDEGTSISSAFEVHFPEFKGLECETRHDKDVTFEQRNATFEDSASDQQR